MTISIAAESPLQEDVQPLISAAHAYANALYPPTSNHYLDVRALAGSDVVFLVARDGDGRAIGTGAVKQVGAKLGEVKQMWADPACRGSGIGRHLLARIETEARRLGLTRLALETGIHNTEALGLYRASGFADCQPFADYRPDHLSVFLDKAL
jgi:putative acetyltransferase